MDKFRCAFCQKRILTCRVKCAVCKDCELCVQCFSSGVQTASHKKSHDYQVIKVGDVEVFAGFSRWSGDEEEALLDAIEQYGFGNWESVAAQLKRRTVEECLEHYTMYYLQGNIGKASLPGQPTTKVKDHASTAGPLSPSLSLPLKSVDLTVEEQRELGYLPLRDDFEQEYDQEAEEAISSVVINYDDDELDIACKLAQVQIFRQRLIERGRRKWIAREYGLIQSEAGLAKKKAPLTGSRKWGPNEDHCARVQREQLRIFARFQKHAEHEMFLTSLQKERLLRQRIKELLHHHKKGITKLTSKLKAKYVKSAALNTSIIGVQKKKRKRRRRGAQYKW